MSHHPRWHIGIIAAATLIAGVVARHHAGGWNDGSRLATVESLIDRGTWAVDESIFVVPGDRSPYAPGNAANDTGTRDLLRVSGHFYSDKSPLPAVVMAAEYALLQRLTGLTARIEPDQFYFWMTLASSGLAYVVAVWSVFRLGEPLGLGLRLRLMLTASFALATVAPTYAAQVNNHILLLAVCAVLCVELAWLNRGQMTASRMIRIGALAGAGYSIDLGVGPVLVLATAAFVVALSWNRPAWIVACGAAAFPFFALHHALNYSIGGTFAPANSVAEYLTWPGSPFTARSMTGGWNHSSPLKFLLYAGDMIVGRRGILTHNLMLALVAAAAFASTRHRRLVLWATCFPLGAWLLYAATSTNMSGVCCSVRWLVPLISPGFMMLAIALNARPTLVPTFLVLSGWGVIYSTFMLSGGPWREVSATVTWLVVGAAAISCAVLRWKTPRMEAQADESSPEARIAA